MHSPLTRKIAQTHARYEARLLQQMVENLRDRETIVAHICGYCDDRRAAELLIEAEDIVRRETTLAVLLEETAGKTISDFVHH